MVGVDTTLDERWEAGTPECMLDFCDRCGDCIACYGGEMGCLDARGAWDPNARHVWLNSMEEVLLV